MNYRLLLGLSASLLTSAVAFADPTIFEGSVTMATSGAGRLVHTAVFKTRPDQTRIETTGADGKVAAIIMDYKSHSMMIIMPSQHMYMKRPIPDEVPAARTGVAANAADALEKTSMTETIAGYPATKYVYHGPNSVTEIWATDQLGSFSALGHGGFGGQRGRINTPQAWEKAIKAGNFFPLRVVTKDGAGVEKVRMEVTAVVKEKLSDAEFAPPAGFQEFDFNKLMPH
jgi:hypothetical protein